MALIKNPITNSVNSGHTLILAATSALDETSALKLDSSGKRVITDQEQTLPAFCQSIEAILSEGLKRGLVGKVGILDRSYWNCIDGLVSSSRVNGSPSLSIQHVITSVKQNKKVLTSVGRGRLFIRLALWKGVLANAIKFLLDNPRYVQYWYKDTSLLVDYSEKGNVVDLLNVISKNIYELDLENCSFLDESWILPVVKKYEFVPCKTIGLVLVPVNRRCIVVEVVTGSHAHEKGISVGDCLDEMFGQPIFDKWCTRISELKSKHLGQPVTTTFVKGQLPNGEWFMPIFTRYKMCQRHHTYDRMPINEELTDQEDIQRKHEFECYYLGTADVGKQGRCSIVQDGIQKLLDTNCFQRTRVKLQLQERDIILSCMETGETFVKISYTSTSSCALKIENPVYFGFVVGNTTCSFAENFKCHVFEADRPGTAHKIIEGIGKGFDRTIYCV